MQPDDKDPFEDMLQRMHPADPDPALRERIAETLGQEAEQDEQVEHGFNRWSFQHRLLTGLAVAAALALAGWVVISIATSDDEQPSGIVDNELPSPDEIRLSLDKLVASQDNTHAPTLHELNLALRASPQQVTELLDQKTTDRLAQISETPNAFPMAAQLSAADFYEDLP